MNPRIGFLSKKKVHKGRYSWEKILQHNLFLFRYIGVFFFNRWVQIFSNTARIITRLCIENLGQLYQIFDWGAFFFF